MRSGEYCSGMETRTFNGYGCVVTWDGETLRAKGTNKFFHRTLMGQNHEFTREDSEGMLPGEVIANVMTIPDELVLKRDEFEIEKFKTGNPITNGNLILRTDKGVKYQLHFRRKDNAAFTELHDALSS